MTAESGRRSDGERQLLEAIGSIAQAIGATIVEPDDLLAGDVPTRWDGIVVAGFRPPDPGRILDSMIETVEREIGEPLRDASRETRQEAVRRLEDRGAFTMRKSVETIADALGVSRFTVYNYINRNADADERGQSRSAPIRRAR